MNRQQENSIHMLLFSSLLGKTTQGHVTPAIQCTNQQQHFQTYSYQLTSKLPAISSSNNFNLTGEEMDRSESIVASSGQHTSGPM